MKKTIYVSKKPKKTIYVSKKGSLKRYINPTPTKSKNNSVFRPGKIV